MAQRFYEPIARIFTNAGDVGVGYKYYFYQTGTTTPVTTYQNAGLTVANTNPVISDANGRFPEIWYSDLSQLKLVVKDSLNNTLETVDPVGASASAVSLNDFDVRPTSYWGLTAGTSTAFTLIANPTINAYANTQTFVVQPHLDCGDSPTLAIDGLSALNWKKYTQQGTKVALKANDLRASQRYFCINDGVDIVCLNPSSLPILSGSSTALTIATGAITLTNNSSSYVIDTEGAAATDDLDTISGGQDGQIIILNSANAARNVVIKHNTGNIFNPNAFDITLDLTTDLVVLRYNSTAVKWIVISVSAFGSSPSVLISSQTASSATSVSFTNLSSQFSKYIVEFSYIIPASNSYFSARLSADNGSTFISANYLNGNVFGSNADVPSGGAVPTDRINLSLSNVNMINTATKGYCGKLEIFNPSNTANHKICRTSGNYTNTSGSITYVENASIYTGATSAINAIQFFFSTGNIASGVFKLYGLL